VQPLTYKVGTLFISLAMQNHLTKCHMPRYSQSYAISIDSFMRNCGRLQLRSKLALKKVNGGAKIILAGSLHYGRFGRIRMLSTSIDVGLADK
jgi:hypothetical protein